MQLVTRKKNKKKATHFPSRPYQPIPEICCDDRHCLNWHLQGRVKQVTFGAGKQAQIVNAKGIEGAMGVSSATAKSTQQAARFATAAKMTGPLALAAGGVEVFADIKAAPEGQGFKYGAASTGALVAGTIGTSIAYYAGVTGTMLLFANPIGAVVVGGALAFGAAWSWNEYASGHVKAFFRGEPMN
jgi:hypothetical protein